MDHDLFEKMFGAGIGNPQRDSNGLVAPKDEHVLPFDQRVANRVAVFAWINRTL